MARAPVPGKGAHRVGERIDHVQVGQGAQNGAPKGALLQYQSARYVPNLVQTQILMASGMS